MDSGGIQRSTSSFHGGEDVTRTYARVRGAIAFAAALPLMVLVFLGLDNKGDVTPHPPMEYLSSYDGCTVNVREDYNSQTGYDDRVVILTPMSMRFADFTLLTARDIKADGRWESFSLRDRNGVFTHTKVHPDGKWPESAAPFIERLNKSVSEAHKQKLAKQ